MRSWFWALAPMLLFVEGEAWAGVGCTDNCTGLNPCYLSGRACIIPVGQTTGACGACSMPSECAPFGRCENGFCLDIMCGADAGFVDTGPADADLDGSVDGSQDTGGDAGDAEPRDVMTFPDATFGDAMSFPDALPTTPGPTGPAPPPLRMKEDGCGCNATASSASAPWALLGLAFGLLGLRRR